MDIRYHFVRDYHLEGIIHIDYGQSEGRKAAHAAITVCDADSHVDGSAHILVAGGSEQLACFGVKRRPRGQILDGKNIGCNGVFRCGDRLVGMWL